ncbi:MAG TPA: helix-turn-helix transcriptional regulator [Anaerolineae bacterium]|nr:helix-turn-helix transcriptional regulator [Anaerolineae bacterium]HQH38688.1 helix-turn-helix transcriptional regulator [Anaerolineae bacterium]
MTKSVFTQEYQRLCELLILARQKSQLTQAELAAALEKPQSFVSKYERSERRLDVIELFQITNVLQIHPVDLMMQLKLEFFPAENPENILDLWKITSQDLTGLLNQSPSLRGMLFGYAAEFKLHELWLNHPDITEVIKSDDHDRKKKGDRRIVYKGHPFILEAKSLQTNSIKQTAGRWCGKTQVDASDRRRVYLPNGDEVTTTLLQVGEFDVLAVNVFPFENEWRFVFAKNRDLPRSTWQGYTAEQQSYLLASLVSVTWPPEPPFVDNLYQVLDELIQERAKAIS